VRDVGKPTSDYTAYVLAGEIDYFVGFPTPDSIRQIHRLARESKSQVVAVQVLEYRDRNNFSEVAKLVFEGGKLWYALLPVSEAESAIVGLPARYGREAVISSMTRMLADVLMTYRIHAYPDLGVAYVERQRPDNDRFTFRVIFAPVANR
jgi:hypothetical protein